jgi:transcriptional regulator
LPPETLVPMVNALSDVFEERLLPKPVWKSAKMGEGVMDRMVRMILPFRLTIHSVEGTWKLNQNKPASARNGVISALQAGAPGFGTADLVRMMGELPD